MGSAKPPDLEYCPGGGDSGAPLFHTKNGQLELVGITVKAGRSLEILLKTGYYCQEMGWLRIAAFHDWIEENK